MAQDFYSRKKFKPTGDAQANTRNNFAVYQKSLKNRQDILLKIAQQKRINEGAAYKPTEITGELNSNFANIGASLNKNFYDWSVSNAKYLDKNSANYDASVYAKHNIYKNDILNTQKKFNDAQASYNSIIKGYQDGELDLSNEEYENVKNQYERIINLDPKKITLNENGNLVVNAKDYSNITDPELRAKVKADMQRSGKDTEELLSGFEAFNFSKTLQAPKSVNYTKQFLDNANYTSSKQDINTSYDQAIVMLSSRDRIGAFTEFLNKEYPNATNYEGMAQDEKYQEEFKMYMQGLMKNNALSRATGGNKSFATIRPGDYEKLLNIQGLGKIQLDATGEQSAAAKQNTMQAINDAISDKFNDYQSSFAEFMRTRPNQPYAEGFTQEDLANEWYKYLSRKGSVSDIKYDPQKTPFNSNEGVIDPNKKLTGEISIDIGTVIGTQASVEQQGTTTKIDRANFPQTQFSIGENNTISANLQNMPEITISDDKLFGAYEFNPSRKLKSVSDDEKKEEKASGKSPYSSASPYELSTSLSDGQGTFIPSQVIPEVRYAKTAIQLDKTKVLGTDDPSKGIFNIPFFGKEDDKTINIPAGAPIDDAIYAILVEQNKTNNIGRKAMVKGSYSSENRDERIVMFPIEKVSKELSQASNHNFSKYKSLDSFMGSISDEALQELIGDDTYRAAVTKEMSKRGL